MPPRKRAPESKASKKTKRKPLSKRRSKPKVVADSPAQLFGQVLLLIACAGLVWKIMPKVPQPDAHTPAAADTASGQTQSRLDVEFKSIQQLPVSERVVHWSASLLKHPDLRDQLGSLPNPPAIADNAPLVPQNFNCTTYIETTLALARSSQPGEFFTRLLEARYKESQTSFLDRNHFPEADWIPNNVKARVIEDITQKVAAESGIAAKTENKQINRGRWLKIQIAKGSLPQDQRTRAPAAAWEAPVSVSVPYLPSSEVERFVDHIPAGSIVNVVRADRPNMPVLISHQGLIVRNGNLVLLRHANEEGKIRTIPLKDYVNLHHGEKWPILGINILTIRESREGRSK
jgi:hypothetical protein